MFKRKKVSEEDVYAYVREEQERFYRIALSYTKREEDALDVVQEAVYKAMLKVSSLKNHQHMETWFYRILINTCIDWLRKNKRYHLVENEYFEGREGDVQKSYLDLYEALDQLDEQQKAIVILRYFEDKKLEEIASILDTNLSTIKTRLYTALKNLKVELDVKE